MMQLAKLSLAAVFACIAVSGTNANDKVNPLIVGGEMIPEGECLYTSGMRTRPNSNAFCGGSLIAPQYVLTAAHCGSVRHVSIGSHYRGGEDGLAEVIAVNASYRHPDYNNPMRLANDFAILQLAERSSIEPVLLGSYEIDEEVELRVQGWGAMRENGASSDELLGVKVNSMSNDACDEAYPGQIDDSMICAGGEGGKDSCQGDSGGPIVEVTEDGDVLVGVVSWGRGCARKGYPGVYGRVSEIQDFIDEYVTEHTWV